MTTVEGRNVPGRNVQVVRGGAGEVLTMGGVKLRVLEDGTSTDQRIGAVEITVPARTHGPPQHWHQMHDETFLVTAGEVTFTSRTTEVTLRAGDLMVVPPMAPHTFANRGDQDAVMFNTFTPGYYVNYFRVMARMMADGDGQLTPEIAREAMLRYATLGTKDHGYDW